jgi:hypothetical protein
VHVANGACTADMAVSERTGWAVVTVGMNILFPTSSRNVSPLDKAVCNAAFSSGRQPHYCRTVALSPLSGKQSSRSAKKGTKRVCQPTDNCRSQRSAETVLASYFARPFMAAS